MVLPCFQWCSNQATLQSPSFCGLLESIYITAKPIYFQWLGTTKNSCFKTVPNCCPKKNPRRQYTETKRKRQVEPWIVRLLSLMMNCKTFSGLQRYVWCQIWKRLVEKLQVFQDLSFWIPLFSPKNPETWEPKIRNQLHQVNKQAFSKKHQKNILIILRENGLQNKPATSWWVGLVS